MVTKGVIKHRIIWIQMIAPIVIIIGRTDIILGHLVESVLALAAVAIE